MSKPIATETSVSRAHDAAVDAIIEALRGLRYGQLEIHLHDGQVVKLMRTEKIRVFEEGAPKPHCTGAG
jgi:hypothetical protein